MRGRNKISSRTKTRSEPIQTNNAGKAEKGMGVTVVNNRHKIKRRKIIVEDFNELYRRNWIWGWRTIAGPRTDQDNFRFQNRWVDGWSGIRKLVGRERIVMQSHGGL